MTTTPSTNKLDASSSFFNCWGIIDNPTKEQIELITFHCDKLKALHDLNNLNNEGEQLRAITAARTARTKAFKLAGLKFVTGPFGLVNFHS